MARKGWSASAESIQESPFPKGKELELSLIGPSFADNYEPESTHNGKKEKQVKFNEAMRIVLDDLNDKEWAGEQADEDEDNFKYAEITTNPRHPYAEKLFDELCKLLGFDDIESKKLRFYNAIDSVLDKRFGTDFFFEIDPSILIKKFGDSAKKIKGLIYITADLTLDPEKPSHKADVILLHARIPETIHEQHEYAVRDARQILRTIAKKLQLPFEKIEEIKEEAEKPEYEIKRIRAGVQKRTRKVA